MNNFKSRKFLTAILVLSMSMTLLVNSVISNYVFAENKEALSAKVSSIQTLTTDQSENINTKTMPMSLFEMKERNMGGNKAK